MINAKCTMPNAKWREQAPQPTTKRRTSEGATTPQGGQPANASGLPLSRSYPTAERIAPRFLLLPISSLAECAGEMSAFDQLAAMPGLRSLLDLAWRVFGVNPALVSPDGKCVVIFEPDQRAQPFCAALERDPAGRALCAMCDQSRFLEARHSALALRYRCHAGLNEFIVPVIRDGEMIALLQCGQVHDREPTAAEWRTARQDLVKAGIKSGPLRALFQQNRVLPEDRQGDLLNLLELIASRLAHADEHQLLSEPGRRQMHLGRAVTFIEVHLGEPLKLAGIAAAAGLSTRSLVRIFQKEVGTTVVDFILRRRIARAKDRLRKTDRTCAEVAFEAGFGSVQHFNRIFRRHEHVPPGEWRQRVWAESATETGH
jgi:AraC-like DNA-binding protein